MKQSEVETILAKLEASVEASHRAQVELLQTVRMLFQDKEATPKPKTQGERILISSLRPPSSLCRPRCARVDHGAESRLQCGWW